MILIIGQICGILNAVFTVLSLQSYKKITMLYWSFIANLMAMVNLILLGEYMAGGLIVITLVQVCVSISYCLKKQEVGFVLQLVFGIISTAAGMITYQNPKDFLRIASNLAGVAATFQQNPQKARWWYLVNGILYLAFAAVIKSSLVISMIINCIVICIGLYRFRNKEVKG